MKIEKLDGLYECILCTLLFNIITSYWWNSDKFLGSILLQAYQFIVDSRDKNKKERLKQLNDVKLYHCHDLMNCTKLN